ncbi:MAG: 50S ribosomal protein L9 [Patescibacteria group bacterium]|nr:50S ribosomal protein L9 [Patescibacteria group bacterium]
MKVVLLKDVENVGEAGGVRTVADGFARNFLIPNKLAEPATAVNLAYSKKAAKERTRKTEKELVQAQKDAERIDGEEFIFSVKTDEDKLFGSIDKKAIIEKVNELEIKIDESSIELDKPIKELGEFPIKFFFNHGIEANAKVIIEKE